MAIGIEGFDHPVIAVQDLEQSRGVYEALGFTVPPRGSHIEWGTGNWCIMFERNYLEHRGILDPARYTHGLEHFLEKREGLMGIAFRSDLDNRDLYKNAVAAGLHPAEPRELTRNFELETGKVPVSFRLVFFQQEEAPALMASLVCEHLTPERLRKPEFLVHPNTALDIFEMTSVVETLDGIADQLKSYFGAEALKDNGEELQVDLPDGGVHRVLRRDRAEKLGFTIPNVPLPYLSSVGIRVKNLDDTRAVLESNRVPFEKVDGRLRIGPAHACGLIMDFAQAN